MLRSSRPAMTSALSLLATCVPLVAGCGLRSPGLSHEAREVADDATEAEPTMEVGATLAALPAAALDASTVTLADAVTAQASLAQSLPEPDCLSVETSGNVVTYTFDACTGPWGQVEVSGREVVTWSALGSGAFEVSFESDGLEVNGRPAEHRGVAQITVEGGGARSISWSGSYEGKTALGRAVSHEAELDISLPGGGAFELDGTASTTIGLRGLEVEYDGLSRPGPQGTCPSGVVRATTKVSRLTLTLTFDGSSQVFVESSRGGHDTLDLECTPAE